ncbi:MAG: flippase [Candidatus Doudnabacteria bacterium]
MLHIGRNILSLLVSRILAAVILFLIYNRLIQYLGPDIAGQYGLLAAYLTVFTFFVDLGMQQLVIKKVSENKAEASKYLGNYFSIQFLLGLGFMLILDVIVLTAHYPPLVKHSLFITGISLLLSSLTMPLMAIINAFQRLVVIARVNFLNSVINAGMMIAAIVFRKNIFFLAFIPGIVAIFDILMYSYFVHKNFTPFGLKFDFGFWKSLFVWNMPFMFLTIFSIYNRIDTLILPHLRSFTENGYYTYAYKFWDTLAFLPAVVAAALYPYFAEKIKTGAIEDVRKVLTTYTRYMIAVGIPLSMGAYLLSGRIIQAFIPDGKFAPAATALWLLISAVSVLFIYVPVNSVIISQKTKTATIITGFNLLFNVVLNLLLIPKFGFVVAAVLTLCSEMVQLIGYTYVVQTKIISFPYLINFVKPILASAVMGFAVYFFRDHNLWLLIAGGGVIYAIVLISLRFFRREDVELLKASFNFTKKLEPDVPPVTHL